MGRHHLALFLLALAAAAAATTTATSAATGATVPPEYVNCTDHETPQGLPCSELPGICTRDIMTAHLLCPRFCKLCDVYDEWKELLIKEDFPCKDLAEPSACENYRNTKGGCDSPLVKALCRETCALVGAFQCEDHTTHTRCADLPRVCHHAYGVLLCPKFCKLCDASLVAKLQSEDACPPKCTDISKEVDCKQPDMCNDTVLAAFLCAKTCFDCQIPTTTSTTTTTTTPTTTTTTPTTTTTTPTTTTTTPTTTTTTPTTTTTTPTTTTTTPTTTTTTPTTTTTTPTTTTTTPTTTTTTPTTTTTTPTTTTTTPTTTTTTPTTTTTTPTTTTTTPTTTTTTPTTTTTTPTTTTTTPTTTKAASSLPPSDCVVCGDVVQGVGCSPLDVVLGLPTTCDKATPYCMNDISQTTVNGQTVVTRYKRCVNEADCRRLWFDGSSDQALCTAFDPNKSTDDVNCHLCCYGDSCNLLDVPPQHTWYRP